MSPYDSDELTLIIEERVDVFAVLKSPDSAEDSPDYEEVSGFPTLELATAHMMALENQVMALENQD